MKANEPSAQRVPFLLSEPAKERRNRIRLCVAAYAYENDLKPTMNDGEYDLLSAKINPAVKTGNALLDVFFAKEFSPYTSMWIHLHPELDKLKELHQRLCYG